MIARGPDGCNRTRQVLAGFDRGRRIEWTPSLIKPPIRIRITGGILAGQWWRGVTALITEVGVITPPYEPSLRRALAGGSV